MTASAIPYFPDDADESVSFAPRRSDGVSVGTSNPAVPEVSDEILFSRLKKKDMAALGVLYERYARLVFSVCVRVLKNQSEAQDLVHDIFLSLYRRAGAFDPSKGSARSWLLQATYHRCFDWRKHLKARHGIGEAPTCHAGDNSVSHKISDPASQIIGNPRMVAAFDRLTNEQQTSLQLYYLHGLSFQEIADQLGCTKGNVKNHVYRGLAHLRQIVFSSGNPQRAVSAITTRKATKVERVKILSGLAEGSSQ